MSAPGTPAVFLDRDDTLIACREVVPDGDLGNPSLVRLLPGVAEGLRALNRAGFFLGVVSNQGGVARGKYGLDQVDACNQRLNELADGVIDAFRFCPYHPSGVVCGLSTEHPWRKPAPGMLFDLTEKHALDLPRSWMVGDAERDVLAGIAAGCRSILIRPPGQAGESTRAVAVVPDFSHAVETILRSLEGTPR